MEKAEKDQIAGCSVGLAIFITLACSSIFITIAIKEFSISNYSIFIYPLLHPLIGKILCEVVLALANAVDYVFEFEEPNKCGSWEKGSKIIFAAAWPVTGPVGFVVFTIALIYGILFKALFR